MTPGMRSPNGRAGLGLAVVVALVVVAGCGGGSASVAADESAQAPTTTGAPTTTEAVFPIEVVDDTGATVRIESAERIIPLDGDLAEVVFALGAGDDVVATDLSATHPPEADALPEVGYQRALSAEVVSAFEPTLLLATDIAGPPEALDDLRRLGYPVVIVPNAATAEGPGEKIRAVAEALGRPDTGEELAAEVDRRVAEATRARPDDPLRVLTLYLRGGVAQLVLGEASASHWLVEAAGGVDVADELGVVDADPISAEAVLAADPEVLIVTTTGLESVGGVDGLLAIGGLAETTAGRNRHVLAFDDQLLLGNGPRVAEALTELTTELTRIREETRG